VNLLAFGTFMITKNSNYNYGVCEYLHGFCTMVVGFSTNSIDWEQDRFIYQLIDDDFSFLLAIISLIDDLFVLGERR